MFFNCNFYRVLYSNGGGYVKKVSIAICDEETTYRERLAEYFIRKKGELLQVFTFSNRRGFTQGKREQNFDIVLWCRGFEEILSKKESELYIYMSEIPDIEENTPMIFKYQSAEEILRKIFECYLELGKENKSICCKEKEIVGIYSPTHSRLQTPFALTLAQIFSEEKKVLYVNLGEWAGFGELLQQEYHRDLADLLYLISGYGSQTRGLLESVLHTVNHMDYIPPMADAQLLCQTTEADYLELLQFLVEKTEYEVIFLDFGIMVPGFFSLLEQCSRIYGVVDQGSMAKGQCRQFETSIMKSGRDYLAERITYVSFSTAEAQIMEQEPVLNQWLYGVLGDRARAVRYVQSGLS